MDNKGKGIDTTPTFQWSALNQEIHGRIFSELNRSDIFECGAVCTSWRADVRDLCPHFLFLSNVGVCRDQDGDLHYSEFNNYNRFSNQTSCTLFNPVLQRFTEISMPGVLEGRWFSASSLGWISTVGIHPPHDVQLWNPFSTVQNNIILPPAAQFRKREGLRVLMSTQPSDPGCVYFATDPFRYSFATCTQGDQSWTLGGEYSCKDAIYYRGDFYVVDIHGYVFRALVGHNRYDWAFRELMEEKFYYLVEWRGRLLLVVREKLPPYSKYGTTSGFRVYEWDRVEGPESTWNLDVQSIGDYAILLGTFSSIAVPVSIYRGFRADCIYFLDDCRPLMSKLPHHDTGVYNMETRSINWLSGDSLLWTSPLNWLSPVFS